MLQKSTVRTKEVSRVNTLKLKEKFFIGNFYGRSVTLLL
jgi:hypothetical protein